MIFFLYFLRNSLPKSRFAVSINGKIANSVKRNYMKRILREWFRTSQKSFIESYDVWISIKRSFNREESPSIKQLFYDSCEKLRSQ